MATQKKPTDSELIFDSIKSSGDPFRKVADYLAQLGAGKKKETKKKTNSQSSEEKTQ